MQVNVLWIVWDRSSAKGCITSSVSSVDSVGLGITLLKKRKDQDPCSSQFKCQNLTTNSFEPLSSLPKSLLPHLCSP